MTQRVDLRKSELLGRLTRLVGERVERDKAAMAETLMREFYANVAPEDIVHRDPESLYGAAMALLSLARRRVPGTPRLRLYNPNPQEHGWQSEHTVVEIVNDDMPFLVDSVTAALHQMDIAVHLVIHPIVGVVRDAEGDLQDLVDPAREGATLESLMHVEIDRQSDAGAEGRVVERIETVLADVRAAVEDWQAMRDRAMAILAGLETPPPGLTGEEAAEVRDFLRWLNDDHFTFLGYRSLTFAGQQGIAVDGDSGLGILRSPDVRVFDEWRDLGAMPPEIQDFLRQPNLLLITKADRAATVHRPVPMEIIVVKRFDEGGAVAGMHAFVGLFASVAYTRSPKMIPVLRRKVANVIRRAGFRPSSHDGKALLSILETYPRDELFQIGEDELFDTALGILRLQERQRIALFVRKDEFERFVSCLVYVPRDRYDTSLRLAVQGILEQAFDGRVANYYTQVGDSPLARLHFIVRTAPGRVPEIAIADIEARLAEAARSWADRLQEALVAAHGEDRGLALFRRFGKGFPGFYADRHSPQVAVYDIDRLAEVTTGGDLAMNLYRPVEGAEDEARLKIYHFDRPVILSDVLPVLENMGFRVVGEVPYQVRIEDDGAAWIHDFGMQTRTGAPADITALRERFQEAFLRVWHGEAEDDGFNRLVLLAGLGWRDVMVLRAYAKYLRQTGTMFSQSYMEQVCADNPAVVELLVRLFHAQFDPRAERDAEAAALIAIDKALDAVASADDDRILRRFLNLIVATLRTNFFQTDAEGGFKPYLSLKLDSRAIEDLPLPTPWVETFVYSPRVEAVHLRGGRVARGGIRWSDRREDFRTEVLGLMKAQMVKNAVIIPVGAKGGFVVKRPPADGGREALLAEGVECYRMMMRGLLDITDNLRAGAMMPPPDVVRRDEDDPYLVVAADKGTASFSDIANAVSLDYGFWLGDAFASGGSQGYDHKAMGITARGAWEAVKRHFREIGRDVQAEDFTVVGVGDMSGDVFGNGMLQSPHIRLVGAFNHLHIFVDPDPDPEISFGERRRLFGLPRSQWSDYDPALLSKGGGVYRRDAKSIALSPEARARFGIAQETVKPHELVRALLRAEVDLLWFGGIGTYVKAADETQAAVGDRANDLLRVDAAQLRCRVVGEGANLAVTQLGRIEYALAGGRINSDAIDNSAGVDTSDHEVNIKILLDAKVADGDMTTKQRNELLTAMTDEVAALVLRDNYLQTQAITLIEAQAPSMLDHHDRLMRLLEKTGGLNRSVEYLPDDEALAERAAAKRGLTRPEIAVLLAYGKIWLYDHLLNSDLPDHPFLVEELVRYFPSALQGEAAGMAAHRLRREIVATQTTNSMINRVGGTFVSELAERAGASPVDVARAYLVVRDAFGLRELWQAVEVLDNQVPAAVQTAMLMEANRLVFRCTLWLLRYGPRPLDIGTARAELEPQVAALRDGLDRVVPPDTAAIVTAHAAEMQAQGVPEDLARRVARTIVLAAANDIARIGARTGLAVEPAAKLYFDVGARFGLGWLRTAADRVGVAAGNGHWLKMAVGAVIDDLHALQRELTIRIAQADGGADDAQTAIAGWIEANRPAVERTDQLLAELRAVGTADLAILTVANRQLRSLADA
ncbi:MAG: NAD-glutamate dehydrogenase [Rhodospirillales bacterium]|nr:NAD-glutamate dehydrogenase [Rhodospirillales bacterium]